MKICPIGKIQDCPILNKISSNVWFCGIKSEEKKANVTKKIYNKIDDMVKHGIDCPFKRKK